MSDLELFFGLKLYDVKGLHYKADTPDGGNKFTSPTETLFCQPVVIYGSC